MAIINIQIDTANEKELRGAILFLQDLTDTESLPLKKETPEIPKKTRASRKKKEETPKEEVKSESSISIDELREGVAKHVHTHRDAIKDKLGELGVKNVTNLDEEDYPAIKEFLDGLK